MVIIPFLDTCSIKMSIFGILQVAWIPSSGRYSYSLRWFLRLCYYKCYQDKRFCVAVKVVWAEAGGLEVKERVFI